MIFCFFRGFHIKKMQVNILAEMFLYQSMHLEFMYDYITQD